MNIQQVDRASTIKLAIAISGFLAAGFLFWYLAPDDGVNFKDEVHLIDVTTGEIYITKTKPGFALPVKHPETKERTLLRIYEKDSVWYLYGNDRGATVKINPEIIDTSDWSVLVPVKNVQRYKRPD